MCGSKTKTNAVEPSSTGSTPRSTPTRSRSSRTVSIRNTESPETTLESPFSFSRTRSIRNTESSGTTSHSNFSFRTAQSTFPSKSYQKPRVRVFTFSELKEATMNFSPSLMIGDDGGFGCVYRGTITTSDPNTKLDVAVKQMGRGRLLGHREWVMETSILGMVEHPNLVKLVGYCSEYHERETQQFLVYEYMANKSVEDHLLTRFSTPLSWAMRLRIAQDVARGLTYLHEEMDFQILCGDFTASDILLDYQSNAKLSLSGFERAWLGPSVELTHVSTAVVHPVRSSGLEYMETGHLTTKSHVWCYGVFLYQLITGRCPLDQNHPESEQKLLDWIRPYLSDMKKFEMLLDPRLEGKYSLQSAIKLSNVADRCLVHNPKAQANISEVLEMVKQIVETTDMGAISSS